LGKSDMWVCPFLKASASQLTRLLKLSFGGVCCICSSGDAGGSGATEEPSITIAGVLVQRKAIVDMRMGEICSYSAESRFSSEYTVRVEGPRWAACGRGGQRRPGSLEARADWAARRAWSGEPRGAEEELGIGSHDAS